MNLVLYFSFQAAISAVVPILTLTNFVPNKALPVTSNTMNVEPGKLFVPTK